MMNVNSHFLENSSCFVCCCHVNAVMLWNLLNELNH